MEIQQDQASLPVGAYRTIELTTVTYSGHPGCYSEQLSGCVDETHQTMLVPSGHLTVTSLAKCIGP